MKRQIRHELRELLRAHPDGLTILEMMKVTAAGEHSVRQALTKMPDAYIDRWVPRSGMPAAVWCVVEVPENCPRPEPGRTKTPEEKRQYHIDKATAAYKVKAAAKKAEQARIKEIHKLASLTVIRGPWPNHA